MAQVIGVQCSVTVGGITVVGLLRGVGGQLQFAGRKILSAFQSGNALFGYAPSTGARSGMSIAFRMPYSSSFLSGLLNPTGSTITLGFGAAGGLSVATCICEQLTIQGSEGGDIEASATFQSTAFPASGSGTATAADYAKFNDVTSFTGYASHTDVNSFSWQVRRTLAAYRGNSPYGIPKYLEVADQEVLLTGEYLKHDDAEGTTQAAVPVVLVQASVVVGQNPLYGSGGGGFTLNCDNAYADAYPQVNANLEDYVTERITFQSTTGTYS